MNVLTVHKPLNAILNKNVGRLKGAGTLNIRDKGPVQWFLTSNVDPSLGNEISKLEEFVDFIDPKHSDIHTLQSVVARIRVAPAAEQPLRFELLSNPIKKALTESGIFSEELLVFYLGDLLSGELKVPGIGEASLKEIQEIYSA